MQKGEFLRKTICFLQVLFSVVWLHGQVLKAPLPPVTRILFVLDASQSMAGTWNSDKKINIARTFLINMVDSLEQLAHVEMALRVYGHQSPVPPQDCSDTKLEVAFAPGNAPKIRQILRFLIPKGTTPIAGSLLKAAGDFPPDENSRNIIILITDGLEACDGDPCAVSLDLQKKGILLRPFIIGIGLEANFHETFDCVGDVYNAESEKKFREALKVVITQALDQTTAQVNLLDINDEPTETDVVMSFYNEVSGRLRYNFFHTMNTRGNPDTLLLDPMITYRLVVHTLPPVGKNHILLTRGKHNIIGVETPQGRLVVNSTASQYRDLKFIVRKPGSAATLNWQQINLPEKYLVGEYEVEVPVLPRLVIKDVSIRQSHTTSIEIPRPGIMTIISNVPGHGSLFVERENGELEWVCNTEKNPQSFTLVLQPGTYRYIFRPYKSRKSIYTTDKRFVIRPGESDALRLF